MKLRDMKVCVECDEVVEAAVQVCPSCLDSTFWFPRISGQAIEKLRAWVAARPPGRTREWDILGRFEGLAVVLYEQGLDVSNEEGDTLSEAVDNALSRVREAVQ